MASRGTQSTNPPVATVKRSTFLTILIILIVLVIILTILVVVVWNAYQQTKKNLDNTIAASCP